MAGKKLRTTSLKFALSNVINTVSQNEGGHMQHEYSFAKKARIHMTGAGDAFAVLRLPWTANKSPRRSGLECLSMIVVDRW